jgi:hypothetical protein
MGRTDSKSVLWRSARRSELKARAEASSRRVIFLHVPTGRSNSMEAPAQIQRLVGLAAVEIKADEGVGRKATLPGGAAKWFRPSSPMVSRRAAANR